MPDDVACRRMDRAFRLYERRDGARARLGGVREELGDRSVHRDALTFGPAGVSPCARITAPIAAGSGGPPVAAART
jgi:hypothetical protein